MVDGMSIREASGVFGLHRDTVRKMLAHSVPPGYRRRKPPRRPKIGPYTGVIDRILEDDPVSSTGQALNLPKKQRHTAKRIYERLREEYGFDGGYTIVKDYVRKHRRRTREMFVPLVHPPGHAQCDFGEAWAVIGGVKQKIHFFVLDLPHSDAMFVRAYPAETTEAFCDGHVSAFSFLGGVPQSIVYDNTRLAVARILGDGRRQRTRTFTELVSHYLFEDRFGRPGKGNDKGKVEGMVGYTRRNFLVPIPSFESFDALNSHLEERCLKRMEARLRGQSETIGERMERDLDALLPLPAVPYDASDRHTTRVSSLSLVRYRTNDYSVPVAYGHRKVLVRGYVDEVVISCGTDVIARHRRSYDRATTSCSTRSTTCRCWSARPAPWTRRRRLQGGTSPRSSVPCAVCWSPGWADGARGSSCRCSGSWRRSVSMTSTEASGTPSVWGRWATTRSSTWCCGGSRDDRQDSISRCIPTCPG